MRKTHRHWALGRPMFALFALGAALSGAANALEPTDREFFETKVRPVLAENCFKCHGPEKQESDMRLDHITLVLAGGSRGPAIVAEDPNASRLVEAIEYNNVDLQMPPNGKLPEEAIADLREWIRRGAFWPDEPLPDVSADTKTFDVAVLRDEHWAWQPIQKTAPPAVNDAAWASTPIDAFILAQLEANGLTPAAEADKRTLIRRLYFDLIGLPPTPDQIDAFLNDDAPDAYARLVDALLASPHFGERWGRHWLDLVRYAETFGHEQDYVIRDAWKYRDYVIRAFNDDLPYPQLIREHIAGDLLPNPRINPETGLNESIVGTGFWFMHQATHGPVDVAADFADRIDNQIDVLSKAFLGMTVSCARCHDHKFDAISTKDYYALSGFMRSTRQDFAYRDPNGVIAEGADRLATLRAKGHEELRNALAANAESARKDVAQYLQAVNAVTAGEWKESDGPVALRPDIVYEDFESGDYGHWIVTGKAFGDAPATGKLEGQHDIAGIKGSGFINTYLGGDAAQGSLKSQPFLIERGYIRFLVGGGAHARKTAVNLIIDGKEVRNASGRNRESLEPHVWDVHEFIGLRGQIQIVDIHDGSWGHINVDHFVFTDSPFLEPVQRPVPAVAQEFGVDEGRLTRWLNATQDARLSDPDHPMYAWTAARGQALPQPAESDAPAATLFESFENGAYAENGWFASGEAFGDAPARPGDWLQDNHLAVVPDATAHSGAIDPKLQGTLRSPTFTIEHDAVHYRVAGKNARIRLVIGQFQLREFNGLLFEGTLSDVNTDGNYTWITQHDGIGKFKGQKAYIEFIDDGDGYIAVDSIWFSDSTDAPAAQNAVTDRIAQLDPAEQASPERRSAAIGDAVATAMNRLANHESDLDGLAAWLIERDLIPLGDAPTRLAGLEAEARAIADALPAPDRVLAATDGTPTEAHLFYRGSHKNPGDVTPRRFLTALDEEPTPVGGGSARLELAERLLDPADPLPARVMANRVWHHLFGAGIVPSVDNFGVLGEAPTHPELLDYIAASFAENGWSVKSLIRDLVNTRTYRMSSTRTDMAAETKDPANTLLHRMRVKRLESEVIRDALLAAADALNPAMYGPSVPAYLSPFNTNHRRPPDSGPKDGDNRRTIYLEVRRNFLSPMQLAFDFPLPDTTIGRRTTSNVPAQALIMMNDEFVVDVAHRWGERLAAREGDTTDARIAYMFERVLGRTPEPAELDALRTLLQQQSEEYGLSEDAIPGNAALWTDMCHTLFTLKEFIFVS